MSNYTKSTNFATKDNLSPGDPLKIVRGTEIDTEFNNIATAIATKTDNASAAITGGSISGITDLAIADGGTGASTATAAINNLLPSQTSNANKYLQTDGTNVSWDAVSLSTSDITGTLPVANGGTGVTSSTGTGSTVLSNSPTLVTPALGTPTSATLTNATGLPISTGVSGLGTGVATFLATPTSANLLATVSDETGTGSLVFATSPTLVTPALGTPSSGTLTNATGLPISTGVSGLGTGVATALAVNVGSAGAPVVNGGALGTPSSGTVTNLTGTASININGTVGATTPTTGAFTTTTVSTSETLSYGTANGVTYLNGSKVLTSGSALQFDGTNLGLGVTPSAWGTSYSTKAFQISASSVVMGDINSTILGTNYYYDSAFATKYIKNNYALQYVQDGSVGIHKWFTAASGTAGNAITFTQAMTLNASGYLGIGQTSPATNLDILANNGVARFNSADANGPFITFANAGTAKGYIGSAYQLVGSSSANDFAIQAVNNFVIATGGSFERARIDSSGNLLVGTTTNTPAQSNVSGFKVGSGQIECNGTNTQAAFFGRSNDGQVVRFYNAGSAAGNISNTGTTTSYNGTSDYRLKDNIQPMVGALEKVAQLKPCTYIWKADGRLGQGFIAHELQEVIPDAVQGTKDEVDENGIPEYQGIDPRMVVATLTAAIQEQQALITSLKARLDAANI